MRYKKQEMDKKGKKNKKVEIQAQVEQAMAKQASEEEEKKVDRYE